MDTVPFKTRSKRAEGGPAGRPRPSSVLLLWAGIVAGGALSPLSAVTTIAFSDLSLPAGSFYNGSDDAGGFTSGGAFFNNTHDPEYGSWGGWAYSNVNDTTTPGWMNQYAAITGTGLGASGIYAVAYQDDYTPTVPAILLPAGTRPVSFQITNTTYAYYTILEGDLFTDPFGPGDYFRLIITGIDGAGANTGQTELYLADYRHSDPSFHYILNDWTGVDVSFFDANTIGLRFLLESSDEGYLGLNTPAYFAMGELAVIPEPRTAALLAGAAAIGVVLIRRRQRALVNS